MRPAALLRLVWTSLASSMEISGFTAIITACFMNHIAQFITILATWNKDKVLLSTILATWNKDKVKVVSMNHIAQFITILATWDKDTVLLITYDVGNLE